MEKTSQNTISPSFSLPEIVWLTFILLHIIFNWVVRNQKLYSSLQSLLKSLFNSVLNKSTISSEKKSLDPEPSSPQLCLSEKGDDEKLCRGDLEMVMEKMGIFCDPDGEKLQERLGLDELSLLFEEKEPSLEEVKEAFDVFDENKDGYIDAWELQRVLCSLGFQEGSRVEDCRRMIVAFDTNGDERIDFTEFVEFMEKSFC